MVSLKDRRILITAGPTWVPVDSVRAISNIATGKTGILLAQKLKSLGARVALLLGPVNAGSLDKKIKIIQFRFFEELKNSLIKELRLKQYDIVIHSAAVSDYRPSRSYKHKIRSGLKNWRLNLTPTEKIIDLIKRIDKCIFLVGFKFETGATKQKLIFRARQLMKRSRLNLVVANAVNKNQYQAYIVNQRHIVGPLRNKDDLVNKLVAVIGESYG